MASDSTACVPCKSWKRPWLQVENIQQILLFSDLVDGSKFLQSWRAVLSTSATIVTMVKEKWIQNEKE